MGDDGNEKRRNRDQRKRSRERKRSRSRQRAKKEDEKKKKKATSGWDKSTPGIKPKIDIVEPLGYILDGQRMPEAMSGPAIVVRSAADPFKLVSSTTPGLAPTTTGKKAGEHQVANCYRLRPDFNQDELRERILIFEKLGPNVKASQLMNFVNTFILAVTQQLENQKKAVIGPSTANFKPVYDCEVDFHATGAAAKVYFRSYEGTRVGRAMEGVEYEGVPLKVLRHPDFHLSSRYKAELEKQNAAPPEAIPVDGEMSTANGHGKAMLMDGDPNAQTVENGNLANGSMEGSKPTVTSLPMEHFDIPTENLKMLSLYELFGIPDPNKVALQDEKALKRQGGRLSFFDAPQELSERGLRDLFNQFGPLKYFQLITLADGRSKGYGLLEYEDEANVDFNFVFSCLDGFVLGNSALKVKFLTAITPNPHEKFAHLMTSGGVNQPPPAAGGGGPLALTNGASGNAGSGSAGGGATDANNPHQLAVPGAPICKKVDTVSQKLMKNPIIAHRIQQGRTIGSAPSHVVQLLNAVYEADLLDDAECCDIRSQIYQEASKYGRVEEVKIPKPSRLSTDPTSDGVGKIFVQYSDVTSARKFQSEVNGRCFDDRVVCAAFYPLERFRRGQFTLIGN